MTMERFSTGSSAFALLIPVGSVKPFNLHPLYGFNGKVVDETQTVRTRGPDVDMRALGVLWRSHFIASSISMVPLVLDPFRRLGDRRCGIRTVVWALGLRLTLGTI